MTNSISSVGALVKVIQSQLAGRPGDASAKQAGQARRAQAGSPYAPDKLETLISLRIKQLGRDDPQRGRKAFRVFLEAVLLSHFGDELVNDPKFYQLVDDIQGAMEADPSSRVMVDTAIAHLLAQDR